MPPTPPAAPALRAAASKAVLVPPRAIPTSVMKNWPVYPQEARRAHREGVVLLSVKISAQGASLDIKVARSSNFPDLDAAAMAAVRNWQFTPATRDGIPTEITVTLPVNFSLKTAPPLPTAAATPAAAQAPEKPKPKPKAVAQKPAQSQNRRSSPTLPSRTQALPRTLPSRKSQAKEVN